MRSNVGSDLRKTLRKVYNLPQTPTSAQDVDDMREWKKATKGLLGKLMSSRENFFQVTKPALVTLRSDSYSK